MDEVSAQTGGTRPAGSLRRGRLRRLGNWYRNHVWVVTALLIVAVVAAGFVVVQVLISGQISGGVSVAGVDLQGKSEAAAARVLAEQLVPRVEPVQLEVSGSEPLQLSLKQLGISLDARGTAAAAWARGRHRLPFGVDVWLPGGGGKIAAVLHVDPSAYEKGLEAVNAVVAVRPRDARLDLSAGRLQILAARDGIAVDAVALERAILARVAVGRPYVGRVPLKAVTPTVSTAVAQQRAAAATAYLSRPIVLRYRTRTVTLTPRLIARMLSVNTGSDASTYPLTFRNDRARTVLHRLFKFAEKKPVNAQVVVHRKGGITVTQSKPGNVLNMPVVLADLDDAAISGGLRTVFVALRGVEPSLSTHDVEEMGLASLGSQFVTYFDPRNTARATNIALAAKAVDGSVVKPGQTFSLNAAIGPRTVNRGFDYAPVIAADNVLRQGVGGGICQYATTLFNAVFFAGLPVVEREAHSLYISHYPIGRDATVSWGGADFRFRNDTAKAVMIRSWVQRDHLTVAIVGRTGRKVSYTTSHFYDIRKPAHGKSNPRVIYDADLGPGMVRWEQGVDGRSVKVTRTVRNASGQVLFRDTFTSHYEPLDWVKRVGT